MKLEQLGRHILVEFYNCDTDILGNHEKIEKIMCEAAIKSNATIVTSCFHKFNPWGVSGAVIIQESHLTIHTWPEYGLTEKYENRYFQIIYKFIDPRDTRSDTQHRIRR